ncbi:hypothetical protein C1646_668918 [Rhizophagus diaphanus]|nr:hypothetical protein C1646_668918 [Rhizophagus diaphanus] [Rhizophagus sp. MUCL 43196]
MSAIITKFMKKNNLNPEMSLGELSQLALKLLKRLTDKVKRDQKGSRSKSEDAMLLGKTTDTQLKEGAVNVYQISQEEIIRELAQHIIQENLSEMKVRDIAKALVNTASNATSGVSHLSQLQKELHNLKVSEKSISATFDSETIHLSNNM